MKKSETFSLPLTKPKVGYVERPWGSFKQFAHNEHCTVSLMTVTPGQRLSLQSHTGRAELWIVIDDGAIVQVGDTRQVRRYGFLQMKNIVCLVRVLHLFGYWKLPLEIGNKRI